MREVVPERLWIGNALDLRNLTNLHEVGITAIVDLAFEEPVPKLTRELIYCRVPLLDGADNLQANLQLAITSAARMFEIRCRTLVACSAGMSRSPAVASAAVAHVTNRPIDQVLEEFTSNAAIDLSPRLWSDVCRALETLQQ